MQCAAYSMAKNRGFFGLADERLPIPIQPWDALPVGPAAALPRLANPPELRVVKKRSKFFVKEMFLLKKVRRQGAG